MQIKKYRSICGLTQKELAKKLGVHQTAVAQWENGRTNPSLHRLPGICSTLRCTINELLYDEQEACTNDDADHLRVGSSDLPTR